MRKIAVYLSKTVFLAASFFLTVSRLSAQQPFVTDDADVTDKGKFHFELNNESDTLQNALFEKTTFDFGILAGRFAASPRFGGQIGFSFDF